MKGYVTNLVACPDGTPVTAEFVIGAYHQLFQIEKSFRMAKSDLQARPVYHHPRDSIEAHLTVVFAALAVSRWIENQTGWSIRKFVKTFRCSGSRSAAIATTTSARSCSTPAPPNSGGASPWPCTAPLLGRPAPCCSRGRYKFSTSGRSPRSRTAHDPPAGARAWLVQAARLV